MLSNVDDSSAVYVCIVCTSLKLKKNNEKVKTTNKQTNETLGEYTCRADYKSNV